MGFTCPRVLAFVKNCLGPKKIGLEVLHSGNVVLSGNTYCRYEWGMCE